MSHDAPGKKRLTRKLESVHGAASLALAILTTSPALGTIKDVKSCLRHIVRRTKPRS